MRYDLDGEEGAGEDWVMREGGPEGGKNVWELKVYALAHELGVESHRLNLRLPKHEMYETGGQLRRAAKSVSANIVEGYGRRRYKAEFLRFLVFAKSSLSETEEHLHYVRDCHPEHQTEALALLGTADALGRRLYRFMLGVETNYRT